MTGKTWLTCVFVCGFGWAAAPAAEKAQSPGWPSWRGPNRDGFCAEVPQTMPQFKLVWRQKMAGECVAPVAAAEAMVVVADYLNEKKDYYRCYSAADGKPQWSFSLDNTAKMDYGAGPRAMPLIHKSKVYGLTAVGHVFCFDLKTGKVLWEKRNDSGKELPTWGFCCSPLIADGKLIVNTDAAGGTVAALDPDTGKVLWTGRGKGTNYASFIAGTFGGVCQVVGYDADTLGGWDVKTGRRLWSFKVVADAGYICPTPVNVGGKVLLTSESEDTRLHAFGKDGKADDKPAADSDELCAEISTPTVMGDLLLGSTDGLVCLDLANDLKLLWLEEDDDEFHGLLHIMASKDRALIFNDGKIVLVAPTREGCRILGKATLCGKTLVYPALTGGRIYVRDDKALYCYQLKS